MVGINEADLPLWPKFSVPTENTLSGFYFLESFCDSFTKWKMFPF